MNPVDPPLVENELLRMFISCKRAISLSGKKAMMVSKNDAPKAGTGKTIQHAVKVFFKDIIGPCMAGSLIRFYQHSWTLFFSVICISFFCRISKL